MPGEWTSGVVAWSGFVHRPSILQQWVIAARASRDWRIPAWEANPFTASGENMNDPYNLQRFVAAQEPVYETVCEELRNGYKRSHWMWFIFPQIHGLGHSDMAKRYAIASRDEAIAYLDHALLGKRLRECVSILLSLNEHSAEQIFGYPDYLKLHSSLTLFAHITDEKDVFNQCLIKYYGGKPDAGTAGLIRLT